MESPLCHLWQICCTHVNFVHSVVVCFPYDPGMHFAVEVSGIVTNETLQSVKSSSAGCYCETIWNLCVKQCWAMQCITAWCRRLWMAELRRLASMCVYSWQNELNPAPLLWVHANQKCGLTVPGKSLSIGVATHGVGSGAQSSSSWLVYLLDLNSRHNRSWSLLRNEDPINSPTSSQEGSMVPKNLSCYIFQGYVKLLLCSLNTHILHMTSAYDSSVMNI